MDELASRPLDLSLFDPVNLRDEHLHQRAVAHFVDTAFHDDKFEKSLKAITERPLLLQYLISSLDDGTYRHFVLRVQASFPTTALGFMKSTFITILHSLAFFVHQSEVLPIEQLSPLPDGKGVNLNSAVLQAISSFLVGDISGAVEVQPGATHLGMERDWKTGGRDISGSLDASPFAELGVAVPNDPCEAIVLATAILEQQRNLIIAYLNFFRRAQVAAIIKLMFIPHGAMQSAEATIALEKQPEEDCDSSEEEEAALPEQHVDNSFRFENAANMGEWQIFLAQSAGDELHSARRQGEKRLKIVLKKVMELSHGQFSRDNHKRLIGHKSELPIYEAKMTSDLRLLYYIDCMTSSTGGYEQVLKILGVYTHAQLDQRFWETIAHQMPPGIPEDHKKRCQVRQRISKDDYVCIPAKFSKDRKLLSPSDEIHVSSRPQRSIRPVALSRDDNILGKGKFFPFTQGVVNGLIMNQSTIHPFVPGSAEQRIIDHVGSSYVVGRSGTGKTTTAMYKMLRIEDWWNSAPLWRKEIASKPRQMFVTRSARLVASVKEEFQSLMHSMALEHLSTQEATQIALRRSSLRPSVDIDLVSAEERHSRQVDKALPFSRLRDEDFPLFVTFDQLCGMVLRDIRAGTQTDLPHAASNIRAQSKLLLSGNTTSVTYPSFLSDYWPHFPQPIAKNLDPASVYSEILSVIKGSEKARLSEYGYLSRSDYENLSGCHSLFAPSLRSAIYTIFESYLRIKRDLQQLDGADRVRVIQEHLRHSSKYLSKIDFLYIDEVQDNLLADVLFLRTICRNPDGLFWAGDTAQTVMVGSSFRFSDLKGFLHRIESELNPAIHTTEPELFQLQVNYRSHNGILACAHSVVKIISHLWPSSIDHISEERSAVDGPQPVFFTGWTADAGKQFLNAARGASLEFGARQCILVRDDAAKVRLQTMIGEVGLILTVSDSKGLEFDDVLLFEFFRDSNAGLTQWRIISDLDIEQNGTSPIAIQELRYMSLCLEQKLLYVSITRARERLWIFDTSEKAHPIQTFWQRRNLVKSHPEHLSVPQLATQSSKEDWAERGKEFFDMSNYEAAVYAYKRAEKPRELSVAQAHLLLYSARTLYTGHADIGQARKAAYLEAAMAFQSCAKDALTQSACNENLSIAGDCLLHAQEYERAAEVFQDASDYTSSSKAYRQGDMFNRAVDIVLDHTTDVDAEYATSLLDVAKAKSLRDRDKEPERVEVLFKDDISHAEKLRIAEEWDLDHARARILEDQGRHVEAAEVHLTNGRETEGIKLLQLEEDVHAATQRMEEYLSMQLRICLSFGTANLEKAWSKVCISKASSYLQQYDNAAARRKHGCKSDVEVFRVIVENKRDSLVSQADRIRKSRSQPWLALLCLDRLYSKSPYILSSEDLVSALRRFSYYLCVLLDIQFNPAILDHPDSATFFGISFVGELVLIRSGTFLHDFVEDNQLVVTEKVFNGVHIPRAQAMRVIHLALRNRISEQILLEDKDCEKIAEFMPPCVPFSVSKHCQYAHNTDHHHLKLDVQSYNRLIRCYMQQLTILQRLGPQASLDYGRNKRRIWISRFYHSLCPIHFRLGNPSTLAFDQISEAESALHVVHEWIREVILFSSPLIPVKGGELFPRFLTLFMESLLLLKVISVYSSNIPTDRMSLSFVDRAKSVTRICPKEFEMPYRHNLLLELKETLFSRDYRTLARGITCAVFILDKGLDIDANCLCDLLEWLTSIISISSRQQKFGAPHLVLLPRSWLFRVSKFLDGDTGIKLDLSTEDTILNLFSLLERSLISLLTARKDSTTSKVESFVPHSSSKTDVAFSEGRSNHSELLKPLLSHQSADSLLFEGFSALKATFHVRQVLVTRICIIMILMAWHGTNRMKQECHTIISGLRGLGNWNTTLFSAYVQAPDWPSLSLACHRFTDLGMFDKLILLLHGPQTKPTDFIRDIKSITFSQPSQIWPLLGIFQQPMSSVQTKIGRKVVPRQSAPPKLSEKAAVAIISNAYARAHRSRPCSGLAGAREAVFDGKIFLGPLPHGLLVLEHVSRWAQDRKDEAKTNVLTARSIDLERVRNDQTNASRFLKESLELKNLLGPASDIHKSQNLELLTAYVSKIPHFASELPSTEFSLIQWDLEMTLKGIVMAPTSPTVSTKHGLPYNG